MNSVWTRNHLRTFADVRLGKRGVVRIAEIRMVNAREPGRSFDVIEIDHEKATGGHWRQGFAREDWQRILADLAIAIQTRPMAHEDDSSQEGGRSSGVGSGSNGSPSPSP